MLRQKRKGIDMNTQESYNGWTNRATWLVNLWIGDILAEYVSDTLEQEIDAQGAESFVLDILETSAATVEDAFTSDLVTLALSQVNWQELAEASKG